MFVVVRCYYIFLNYLGQLFFEKDSLVVKLKTVINKEAGISILSKCKKIDNFDKKT